MTNGIETDPRALVDRVLEQVVDQLTPDDVRATAGDVAPAELLATVLGNRLARMIAGDEAPHAAQYEQLVDRNRSLASALGACDCWGQDRDCPSCAGAGGPGWVLPDEQLFAAYVGPVLGAVARQPTDPSAEPRDTTESEPIGA